MNDMSEEKSVLLAKATGVDWRIIPISDFDSIYEDSAEVVILDSNDILVGHGTLYDPANMALAWRVHLWMGKNDPLPCTPKGYIYWWNNLGIVREADAQRLWLDKILSLAIEAGIVEVE